ncbi:aminopeptidase C [Pontimonas salivibrio]|uniref:Aminopeptidase C n=1 Tax=Pontimonas salivibrio TaxID=1159327 RepID=A0A2L2BP73_9MICO|nr:DUF805 domain-containing protein [Pontimonas salivibrio]AVG23476.1 aminopeptidase C [Pontimonas salivibrio]
MSFGQAVSSFFSNYANFQGRTQRSGYWWVVLFLVLVSFVLWFVDLQLFAGLWSQDLLDQGSGPLSIVFGLAIIVPVIALGVRRLHDTNRSGWWVLLGFIPIIGSIVLFVFYVLDSTPGDNQYGPNPKGVDVGGV